jgi:hypothetical protein
MNVQIWTDDLLDQLRHTGDPAADDVVARYFQERQEEPRQLVRRLVKCPVLPEDDRPPSVDAYHRDTPPWPDWADEERIRRGTKVFEDWGLFFGTSLFCASLPQAYAAAKGVQVLRMTSRLASDAQRRIYETAQMVVDVMTPGGLEVGAAGYYEARQVRLMHAAVRYLIQHDPDVVHTCDPDVPGLRWCEEWGVPINQEDLVGTLMTFTVVPFESLRRFGVKLSDRDAEDYLHAWNVVGYLLGIREDLLPIGLSSANELWAKIQRRHWRHSPEGVEMTEALVRQLQSQLPAILGRRIFHPLPASLIRYLVGDEVSNMLGVGPSGRLEKVFLRRARRVMSGSFLARGHNPVSSWLSRWMSRRMFQAFLQAERGGSRASFSLPEDLANHWRVKRVKMPA